MLSRRGFVSGAAASSLILPSRRIARARSPHGRESTASLQAKYVARGLIIFNHFGIATFTDNDFPGVVSSSTFALSDVDTDQWALQCVAAKAAGMCLTAVHESGHCNWYTATNTYNVSTTGHGTIDVCKKFVESMRKYNLIPMFYICIKDNYFEANNPGSFAAIQAAYKAYKQAQITELLTNYGPIGGLWVDADNTGIGFPTGGYPWASYQEANAFVRSVQWNCLSVNNAQGGNPNTDSDIAEYEGGSTGQFVPPGNTNPAECCDTIYTSGFPRPWFYKSTLPTIMDAPTINGLIATANSRNADLMINTPANTAGIIESRMQTVLTGVGGR